MGNTRSCRADSLAFYHHLAMPARRGAAAILCALGVFALAGLPFAVLADSYPSRPIRLIVPYPPGGGTDVVARTVAQKVQASVGQPVVVDNRPGASEVIGTSVLANSPGDGYTIALVSSTFSVNASLFPKLPYDSARDFVPVTALVGAPMMAVVPATLPVKSLRDFVMLAKARPGQLNYASLGPTSLHAISTEWFKHLAGIDVPAVPYKGAGPGLAAVSTDEVQFMFTGLAAGLAQVQGGRLRALAVSTAKRLPAVPDLPSIAEEFPDFDVAPWYGLLAPAATPSAIVSELNAEVVKALNSPDLQTRFATLGVEPWPMTPQAFAEFLRKDTEVWSRMIKATGTKHE